MTIPETPGPRPHRTGSFRAIPGGGIETTRRMVGLLISLGILTGAVLSAAAWTVHANDRLANATARTEFLDTTTAIRRALSAEHARNAAQDSVIAFQGTRIIGILCSMPQNHSSDFCHGATR